MASQGLTGSYDSVLDPSGGQISDETLHDQPEDTGGSEKDATCVTGESDMSQRLRQHKTLTEKGKSEHLRLMKNKTVSALSACTKHKNELDRLMQNNDNLHLVKTGFDKFNDVFFTYKTCIDLYFSELDEEERSRVLQSSDEKMCTFLSFRDLMVSWIQYVEKDLSDEVHDDSISKKGSVKSKGHKRSGSSTSSHSSTIRSSYTHEKAKLAELLAERSMFQAQMRMKQLQLDIQIAKSTAREKVYAEVEGQRTGQKVIDTIKTEYGEAEHVSFLHKTSLKSDTGNVNPLTGFESERSKTQVLHASKASVIKPVSNKSDPLVLNPTATDFVPSRQESISNYMQDHSTFPDVDNQSSSLSHVVVETQKQLASAIFLPKPEVPKFTGDPTEFSAFMMAFDARVVPYTSSEADRLYYLDQQLQGEPKTLISGCMHMDTSIGYTVARDVLCREYGDPYKVSSAYLNKVRLWPNLKNDDYQGLKQLSTYLIKCYHVMQGVSHMAVLDHAPNMQSVVQKLPLYLQGKWRDHVTRLRMNGQDSIVFKDLVDFVDFAARSANEPIYGKQALTSKSEDVQFRIRHPQRFKQSTTKPLHASFVTHVGNDTHEAKNISISCYFCKKPHDIDDCRAFLSKPLLERRNYLKDNNRCYSCYGLGHISKGCTRKRICKRCNKRHPTALHDENFQIIKGHLNDSAELTSCTGVKQVSTSATSCNSNRSKTIETVLQPILPVQVRQKGSDKVVTTYAMLDNGSTGCFITQDLKDKLGASSIPTTLRLQTMSGTDLVSTHVISDLVISDLSDSQHVRLPRTFCKDAMPVDHEHIPKAEMLMQLPYFKDVVHMLPPYLPDLDIGLLIGSDCSSALQPLEVIPSCSDGPFAVRYKHGWTINGPLHIKCNLEDKSVVCNTIVLREHERTAECISPDTVLRLFELDFNERDIGKVPGECGYSIEDQSFMTETEETMKFVNGHFEIPLPFRNSSLMPCNREQAVKRLFWQKKKMLKNDTYCEDYVMFMNTILANGYAKEVPDEELLGHPGRVWYLPHHGVYHPKKPHKIRVVFDCSAKFDGLCLNDVLLQGPDLANSLVGVLTRFRSDKVAFMGDVESMFHQVNVPQEQQDYLRFLWWPEGNILHAPKDYRMTVHTFGTVSSPAVANYALRATASKARCTYSEQVAETIERNFYVDDCLKSVESEDCAIELISNLKLACADGGFKLTKFTSNSKAVLSSIPQEHRSKEIQAIDLDYNDIPMERALGMQWDITLDSFKYMVDLPEKPFTRRGILSMVSSLYDPLGLVSPVLLPAKKLLQDLCKDKSLDWDDDVGTEYGYRWKEWLRELELLKEFTVTRCLKPSTFEEIVSQQLHIFSDASTTGYGCCAYIRLFDIRGNIHTALLLGKARLAPLKTQTIPRLELTAASVSVKIGQFLLKELDMNIDTVTYYTDSTTVLSYICSERNRFPVFVTNRVTLIRDYSTPEQWKYVESKANPADIASRGTTCSQFLKCHEWFDGPAFLRIPDSESSVQDLYETTEASGIVTADELKYTCDVKAVDRLINHYSSWYRLKRAVAIYRRFFKLLQVKRKMKNLEMKMSLSLQELQDSENAIITFVQKTAYEREIGILSKSSDEHQSSKSCKLPRQSSIRTLNPVLFNGLLHVGGRLSKADISDGMKYPVLLPRKSHVSSLIIQHIHETMGHVGRNHVIAALREHYWITNANSAVRSILNKCVTCRRFKKPTSVQMMSDLPANRVQPSPPFTYTGLDFFGPHTVKEGRKNVKRYGVLFTCLVSRAVHIETANSMDTDSFLNALRRFIARRGPVKEISCDNGTNFTSGARELRKAIDAIDQSQAHAYLLKQNIIWKFNPPSASHMGGVWERLIRSVRSVLNPLLHEFGDRLDDELYRTLLCEVEAILNSRPLTTVSSDPSDLDPLTPNHLLMVKSSVYIPPPGVFQSCDVYARRRWRRVQYLAGVFWGRWKKEYLCTLQQRQKWYTPQRNFQFNDIVLIKDDTLPRSMWSMGRVMKTEPDDEGNVGSLILKTRDSKLRRPIHKLVLLLPADTK